uniref:Uncharacterized protein n=1 Tax=Strongyloides venezuelensis TaxID=75913 RepID=A0A0K0G5T1_STRVS
MFQNASSLAGGLATPINGHITIRERKQTDSLRKESINLLKINSKFSESMPEGLALKIKECDYSQILY